MTSDDRRYIELIQCKTHLTALENFNRCLSIARGELVHILHDDDYVLDGFYREIEELSHANPALALYATRCNYISQDGQIIGESGRLDRLRGNSRDPSDLFIENQLQFAGIALRREFFKSNPAFSTEFQCSADLELWIRAIALGGGVCSDKVLAAYRVHTCSGSNRVWRSTEDLLMHERLYRRLAIQFSSFPTEAASARLSNLAREREALFWRNGDIVAAKNNASQVLAETP